MNNSTRLQIIQGMLLVSGLAIAVSLQSAVVSRATADETTLEKVHSVVMNWPMKVKRKVWNRLNVGRQHMAIDLVKGESSPLKHFPPGLVPLIVSYMDIGSKIKEYCEQSRALEPPIFKPICGLDTTVSAHGKNINLKLYCRIASSKEGRMCNLTIDSAGEIKRKYVFGKSFRLKSFPRKIWNINFEGFSLTEGGKNYSPEEIPFPDELIHWDTGKSLDCRIADYDPEVRGGTVVEWNVYDRKEAETICALYYVSMNMRAA